MATIINILGSTGKTPFELCGEQFFYCTNSEISTLGARNSLAEPEEYMQMGYTQLYFCERFILWDEANDIYRKYYEPRDISPNKNIYRVIGNNYLMHQGSNHSISHSSLAEAEEFMKSRKMLGLDSILIVAEILSESYWH